MVLAVVRHAESVENADKYNGFYQARRPYSGQAAHEISRNVVGLTPRGFRQALWLGDALTDLNGPGLRVYTSTYRRAIDTAAIAFPSLLDEQHYGDATYMTKEELFATYPDGATDRRMCKHLWIPPGGGEALADAVWRRAAEFAAILALRAILELRPITDLVDEARKAKTPTAGVLRYELAAGRFRKTGATAPPGG